MDSRYPFMLLPRHKAPKEYVADPLGCDIRTQLYVGLPSVFGSLGGSGGDGSGGGGGGGGVWEATSRFPKVTLSRPLGEAGEIAVETEALLVQHGFGRRGTDGDFSSEVLECLENFRRPTTKQGKKGKGKEDVTPRPPKEDAAAAAAVSAPDADDPRTGWTIPPEELSHRRDLRTTRIFSIDPTTGKQNNFFYIYIDRDQLFSQILFLFLHCETVQPFDTLFFLFFSSNISSNFF